MKAVLIGWLLVCALGAGLHCSARAGSEPLRIGLLTVRTGTLAAPGKQLRRQPRAARRELQGEDRRVLAWATTRWLNSARTTYDGPVDGLRAQPEFVNEQLGVY